jgi:hypothetical protein
LQKLIKIGLKTHKFTWFDTGTAQNYEKVKKHFNDLHAAKPDEHIYFENDLVIKFFSDKQKAENRFARSKFLNDIVPKIIIKKDHFYGYRFIEGKLISQISDKIVFKNFLDYCNKILWQRKRLDLVELEIFHKACLLFYYNKTKTRLELYFENTGEEDIESRINGVSVPSVYSMLENIDWDWMSNGIAARFHGDLQPENVLIDQKEKFWLIDWRENFCGNLEYGDIYYDLAKIYHALLISQEIIRKDEYQVDMNNENVSFNFYIKHNLMQFQNVLNDFISDNDFDLYKVKLLSALIYLNICPLHHHPYNHLLFNLGKLKLYEILGEKNEFSRQSNQFIFSGKNNNCAKYSDQRNCRLSRSNLECIST